jgi:hypothetical protein
MEQCDEREKTQVNNLHLGRDLSRVSDFVLYKFYFRHHIYLIGKLDRFVPKSFQAND